MKAREARVTVNKEFKSVEEFVAAYVTNISRSGVFIRSEDPLPIGTVVNLHFTVVCDDLETITGTGKVVRLSNSPKGMGVTFRTLSGNSAEIIDRLLAKARKK